MNPQAPGPGILNTTMNMQSGHFYSKEESTAVCEGVLAESETYTQNKSAFVVSWKFTADKSFSLIKVFPHPMQWEKCSFSAD